MRRTVVDVEARPDRLSSSDHPCLLPVQSGLDEHRDLDRMRVRDARADERVRRSAVDGGWDHEQATYIACLVRLEHLEIDVAMQGGGRDRLGLLDAEVVKDGLVASSVLVASVVHHNRAPGLQHGYKRIH